MKTVLQTHDPRLDFLNVSFSTFRCVVSVFDFLNVRLYKRIKELFVTCNQWRGEGVRAPGGTFQGRQKDIYAISIYTGNNNAIDCIYYRWTYCKICEP